MMSAETKEAASKTMRSPLVWMTAVFAVGVLVGSYFPIPIYIPLSIAALVLAATFRFVHSNSAFALILISSFFVGIFCSSAEINGIAESRIKRIYDERRIESGTPVEIEGTLSGYPETAFDGVFLSLDANSLTFRGEKVEAHGTVRLFLLLKEPEQKKELADLSLSSGVKIRTACSLKREDQYLNPGVLLRKTILDQQGIDATCTVKSTLLIEKLDGGGIGLLDSAYSARQWLIDGFARRLEPATAGVMIASLLGNKHYLDRSTAEAFRDGGTFHILVISGLHVTFIGGLILLICRFFTSDRRIQLVVAGGLLWMFTFAVGAEVPVVRATLMFSVFLISRVLYRTGSLMNSLAFCLLLLLVWRPSDLFSPSFQLTALSVIAIVGISLPLIERLRSIGSWMPSAREPFPPNVPSWLRRFCETLYWNDAAWEIEAERQIWSAKIFKTPMFRPRRILFVIFELLTVSTLVQICMLPFAVHYFHRVSPLSLFLNVWVGVVIAIQSFVALIAVAAGYVSQALSWPFAKLAEVLNWLLIIFPQMFTGQDWASFRVPIYAGYGRIYYALFFVPVLLLVYLLHKWDVFALRKSASNVKWSASAFAPAFIVGAILIFHPLSAPSANRSLNIDLLDVGQGDSALVTFPNGETMLIDGGGSVNYREESDGAAFEPDRPRIGEMVVSEFLWEKGYSSIDYVVVSHADADHSQGLADVVRNFRVGKLFFGAESADGEADELLNTSRLRGTPVERLRAGDLLEIGGVKVDILWPREAETARASDNNASLVMRLSFGDKSILFTGDIEKETEGELVHSGVLSKADVVKVPHHGSRTSSTQEFIDLTKPSYAIVPVGKRSMFGHPHADVVKRWLDSGTTLMTTGERGTISISTDGRGLSIKTFRTN